MTHVGRKRNDGVINVYTLPIPLFNSVANKGVTKIMNPRMRMAAASSPPEMDTKTLKDSVNSSIFKPQSLRRNEEAIGDVGYRLFPGEGVVAEDLCGTQMYRDYA